MSATDLVGARIGMLPSFSCKKMALAPGMPFSLASNVSRTETAGCMFGAVGPVVLRSMRDLTGIAAWAVTATAEHPIAAAIVRMHEAIAAREDPAKGWRWRRQMRPLDRLDAFEGRLPMGLVFDRNDTRPG